MISIIIIEINLKNRKQLKVYLLLILIDAIAAAITGNAANALPMTMVKIAMPSPNTATVRNTLPSGMTARSARNAPALTGSRGDVSAL